jgi:hypothetical protein
MIMVMIVPVALRVPPMGVFVPPSVGLTPTILARLMQLVTRSLCLWTVPSMMLGCFMKPVIRLYQAVPARIVIRSSSRSRTKQHKRAQRRHCKYNLPDSFPTSHQKTLHEFFPPRSAQGRGLADIHHYKTLRNRTCLILHTRLQRFLSSEPAHKERVAQISPPQKRTEHGTLVPRSANSFSTSLPVEF